jgi:site-specific recombinase XerD
VLGKEQGRVLTIYYVSLGGSLEEMKRIYRAQEERRHPGKMLPHLDERMNKVRVVLEKNTSFRSLMLTAEDRSVVVIDGLNHPRLDIDLFVDLYEKRRKDGLYVRLLDENLLLDPKEQMTSSFLTGVMNAHQKKLRPRRLPSIAEAHGKSFISDMQRERREGATLEALAKKYGVSVSAAHRYTRGHQRPLARKVEGDKSEPAPSLARLGNLAETPEERLEQLLEIFLSGQRKPATAKLYRKHLGTYRSFAASVLESPVDRLDKFTLESVVAFKQYRSELGKQPATIASELSAVKAFLGFCAGEEEIPKNPLQRLKVPKVERKVQTEALTRDETAKVIATAQEILKSTPPLNIPQRWKAHRDLLAVYLLAGVGMRHSGLLSLRKCDLLETRRGKSLAIESKANADRYTVGVSKPVADMVEAYIERYFHDAPPEAYLFSASLEVKDKPLGISTSCRRISSLFDKAGITPITAGGSQRRAHSLRVSWAKFAYEDGADIRSIQLKMNHSAVDQTYAYLKIDDAEVDTRWLPTVRLQTSTGVRL